jgi:hypothetical protein
MRTVSQDAPKAREGTREAQSHGLVQRRVAIPSTKADGVVAYGDTGMALLATALLQPLGRM